MRHPPQVGKSGKSHDQRRTYRPAKGVRPHPNPDAERLGLKLRAYQDLEAGQSEVRKSHDEAAAMASLRIAVERGNPMLALPEVRRLALRLTQHIMGEDPADASAKEGNP